MTDLQFGLAVIGVLVVAGVLLYNRWQERTVRRDAERAFGSGHADVLMGDGRREPTLEPRRAPAPPTTTSAAAVLPAERVDYVMELALAAPAALALVHEAWAPIERRFARRALLVADQSGIRAALQLVSRNGVVSDAELLEFRALVETMAAQLGAKVQAPEMREALDAARELDRTCADADIQIALHVVGIGTAPAQFAQMSTPQPFEATARDDGVTLTLDVARTPEPSRSYEAMARAGRELARSRGGRMVDDTGRELDERALAAIARELDAVRARLAGCGIEPGSPLALRVFS
jgi:ZipA-like protein with FtsZ-binding domain